MRKRLGEVHWANSKKIDKTDNKARRLYAIMHDNGKNIGVSKIRGYNNNTKNKERLYKLNIDKYPLTKHCGIDKKIYYQRNDNKCLLKITDKDIFDIDTAFVLSSHDTHRAMKHTGALRSNKKGRKN